jgi:ATP-dependent Lon protease
MPSKFKTSKQILKKNKQDSDSDSDSDSESDSDYIYESVTDTGSSYIDESSVESLKKKKKKKNKSNKKFSKKHKHRKYESEEDSEDDEYDEDDDEDEIDEDAMAELHNTLHKLFPSKYTKDKLKSHNKPKSKPKPVNKHKKSKRIVEEESEEEESESEYETMDEEEEAEDLENDDEAEENDNEDEDDDEDIDEDDKNFKITLTIGGNESQFGVKNRNVSGLSKDDEYTSEDEKTFMRETYEEVGLPLSPSNENLEKNHFDEKKTGKKEATSGSKSPKNKLASSTKSKKDQIESDENDDVENKYKEIIELKKVLYEKHRNNPKNKIIKTALEQCDQTVKKLIRQARSKNVKRFEELLFKTDTQENTDELGYFKKKLSNKEQLRIMKDMRELHDKVYVEKPYRLSLLQSNLPANLKAMALQRLNQLAAMEPGEPEYYKLKNWVDSFMRIPFGKHKNITININDGIDKCNEFIVTAKTQLDNCVYGLNDAKMQIMQMVGQWISNPGSLGTAIAVKGPPGTGKTSLIKDGVSKILGREFAFIALGGCGDSSFLEGHSYTYEGSIYGKIVQILMDSKCMNPVIYFDELDKVSDTARGQEIISLLTHLTDTTQNNQFHDKYFSEVDFDLSKCLFIFSYNDENLVNPILKDRMYRIQTKGYDLKEKLIIARNYMLPKIREQVGFKPDEVVITDEVLSHIISNQAKGEAGVRNLKRCLEIVHTKLNLYRLVKSGTQLFEKDMGLHVTFPYTVTRKDVDQLIKVDDCINQSVLCSMYL